jgi:transposase
MKNASFETDLTDARWEYLKPMLTKPKKLGRPPTDRRVVLDAILYVLKGGIAWRLLPKNFPPWKTVYHVFRAWSLDGTWAALNDALRVCVRVDAGRAAQPSAAILDSQSVKSDGHGGTVGYDAGKKINGRKRHLLVDTLGLVLGVVADGVADYPEDERRCFNKWATGSKGCASSGWMVATRAKLSHSGSVTIGRNWKSKWSSARTRAPASPYCRIGGSSSAPLAGSCAIAGSSVTTNAPRPVRNRGSIWP